MKTNNFQSLLNVFFLILFVLFTNETVFSQLGDIKDKIPKRVPIKIEVKNQHSENWVDEMEIKVTNTGNKPIYYLSFLIILEGVKISGYDMGFPFKFGNREMYSKYNLAQPDYESILPNESYTFKIDKSLAEGWKIRVREGLTDVGEPYFMLGWLNFGDGDGFSANGTPFKKKI